MTVPVIQPCIKQEGYEDQMPSVMRNDEDIERKSFDYRAASGKQALIETLPLLGEVPLVFYLPPGTD